MKKKERDRLQVEYICPLRQTFGLGAAYRCNTMSVRTVGG